jgi:hypothetical protein
MRHRKKSKMKGEFAHAFIHIHDIELGAAHLQTELLSFCL